MASLRDTLIEISWRQGVILDPRGGLLEQAGAHGFIVLNQTCDCISEDIVNEPCFEVLPFEKMIDTPDPMLINGRNARRIHFQLEEKGSPIWVSSRIADIRFVPRTAYVELAFSTFFSLPVKTLEGLISWRAARYLRPAFPDDFERALAKPLKKIGKIFKKNENLIEQVLIGLEPKTELEEDDYYEVSMKLMAKPAVYANSENARQLEQISQEIQSHLSTVEVFYSPRCSVQSLAEMSLWEREDYLEFSRYDYLSFDEEQESS
jgi:hypothetical protein